VSSENRKGKMEQLKPEQAVALLRKKGIEISQEQAVLILEILRMFANILVEQYLKR
jgi:hypothetical protein